MEEDKLKNFLQILHKSNEEGNDLTGKLIIDGTEYIIKVIDMRPVLDLEQTYHEPED